MLDPSPARRRRKAAPVALATLALGLFAASCSSNSTTSTGTSTTAAAKTGGTDKVAPAASSDIPGIPTFEITVKEEAESATGGSSTTMKATGSSTTMAGSPTTMSGSSTTMMNGGSTPKAAAFTNEVAQDDDHSNTSGSTPGTAMAGGGMTKMSFESPDTIPSGLVMIDLKNTGKQAHQVNIARPKDPANMAKIDAALKTEHPELALALVEFVGGSNAIEPGAEQKSVSKFEAGSTYYILCFIVDEDGESHILHGMVKKIVAGAASSGGTSSGTTPGTAAKSEIPQDQADAMKKATVGEVKLKDFNIALPDNFNGKGWYKVSNDEGQQPHEMSIVKLKDGKTKQDVIDWATPAVPTGPPPFESAGGFGGLDPKGAGWVYLDLSAGNYLALCYIPNTVPDKSGPPGPPDLKPHFAHGMVTEFTIK